MSAISAFNKAIKYSNKVAMTLSDKFCVDRHRVNFLELVKNRSILTNSLNIYSKNNFLKKTNIKTLELIPIEKLKKFALDLS